MNLAANPPCPCRSGKPYPQCCGRNKTGQLPSPHQLLAQAMQLRQAGRSKQAVSLCRQALQRHPDDALVLNALAVLLADQGHMLPAFEYAIQAGLSARWTQPGCNENFRGLARQVLNHLDAGRAASRHQAWQAWNRAPRGIPPARVAVLLDGPPDELQVALDSLQTLARAPAEVLLPAESLAQLQPGHEGLPLRGVDLPAAPAARAQALAAAARADYLLLPGLATGRAAELLEALASRLGEDCRWALACDAAGLPREEEMAVHNALSAGHALLAVPRLGLPGTPLLVCRALHQQAGGPDPASPLPWLAYCLRLLWLAEPALQPLAGLPPGGARPAPAVHAAVLEPYLTQALTDSAAPNPFAPGLAQWGLHLPAWLIDEGLPLTAPLLDQLLPPLRAHLKQHHEPPLAPQPGINLVGAAAGELGLGENMRAIARALIDDGIPCAVRNFRLGNATSQGDHALIAHYAERAPHRASVFFLNPDLPRLYGASLDTTVFNRPQPGFPHRRIGYWFWELEKLPEQWRYAFDKVDEIWVATGFVAEAVRRATGKPVVKIPPPIRVDLDRHYRRSDFGLPEDTFLFLFSFDFNSFPARKNPLGVLRAFLQAFPPRRRDVALVIKTVNGANRPQDVAALLEAAGHDGRILLRDGRMSREQMYGLQSVVDAYVSLHRSEGLGLGLAESMYLGKPVIATGYSGNLEFMDDSCALLVDHRLVPVRPGEYAYDDPDYFWAQPDEEHAAQQMRRLVDEAGLGQHLGQRGRQHILDHFNAATTAARVRARMEELGLL